jgi:hypothetical protein
MGKYLTPPRNARGRRLRIVDCGLWIESAIGRLAISGADLLIAGLIADCRLPIAD